MRRHHFLLLQQVVLPGVFDDGGHVGGHIAALIILCGDQRAAPPDTVNGVLLALQQHTKAVGALHLRRSGVNGGNGVILLLHVVIQQCCGDLGIGLGQEVIPLRLQPFPQRPVVFYNAVMHQGHPPLPVGVGVYVIGDAVGGPAGMPYAAMAGKSPVAAGRPQVGKPARRLDDLYFTAVPQGKPGAVVAPVFQIFQPVQQLFPGVIRPRITDNSTHK